MPAVDIAPMMNILPGKIDASRSEASACGRPLTPVTVTASRCSRKSWTSGLSGRMRRTARRDTPQATGGTYTDADVQNALKDLQRPQEPAGGRQEDIFGKTPPRPQASAPAEEPITPERRFLDLPSIQQLPLEERTQRFKEFYGLPPAFKEEFLRSEEPPSDLVIDIEKPAPPAPPGAAAQTPQRPRRPASRPAHQRLASPAGPHVSSRSPARSTEVLQAEINRPAPLPVPPEAAIAAIPGMAGYAIGARLAPLLGPIGRAVPPLLEAAGGYLGHRANVKLGYEQEGVGGDLLSVLPLVTRSLGSATAGWLERTMKEVPAAARNQTLDLLGKLFSRGGAPATLTYALSGDPQLAAFVGGSTAVARQLLEFGLRHPAGKQLVETTLKAGRAIGGEELGMLMNIGRTGHTATPHSTHAREGKAPVDLAPLMDHPHWKTLTDGAAQGSPLDLAG